MLSVLRGSIRVSELQHMLKLCCWSILSCVVYFMFKLHCWKLSSHYRVFNLRDLPRRELLSFGFQHVLKLQRWNL